MNSLGMGKRTFQEADLKARFNSFMSVVKALEKLRQEDCFEFKVSLGYVMRPKIIKSQRSKEKPT